MRIQCIVKKGFSGKRPGDSVMLNRLEARALEATGHVERKAIPKGKTYSTRDMKAETVGEYPNDTAPDTEDKKGSGKSGRSAKREAKAKTEPKE